MWRVGRAGAVGAALLRWVARVLSRWSLPWFSAWFAGWSLGWFLAWFLGWSLGWLMGWGRVVGWFEVVDAPHSRGVGRVG